MPEPSEHEFLPQDRPEDGIDTGESNFAQASPAGNRPADGAPVLNPDQLSEEGFAGGQGGDDFLGLQGQAAAAEAQVSAETASALADAPEMDDGAFEQWLEDESEDSASWLMELDEEPGEDVFDPERLEAEFGVQSESTTTARGGWILRLTLVAAGLGAGFVGARWYGHQQAIKGNGTPIARVARPVPVAPTATTGGAPATTATATGEAPTGTGPSTSASPAGTTATTPTTTEPATTTEPGTNATSSSATGSVATAPTTTTPTTEPTTSGTTPTTPRPDVTPTTEGPSTPETDLASAGDEPTGAGTRPKAGGTFTMPVEDMVVVPRVDSPVKFADSADLAAVWSKREIPMNRIDDEQRMMTPQVGRVRLVIHGGEVFEGQLYAVGEHKVWLDTGLGKMALLGWQVDRIEHIDDVAAPALGEKGSEDLAGLQRVRVRTPGGVFYGKLLDESQGNVTLITEDGGRIRLKNARVEPAGKSRTRIVDPGSAAPKEAASEKEEAPTTPTKQAKPKAAKPR